MGFFKARRGFAAMSPAKRAAISSKGGKAAHIKGAAHQFTAEEARRAGRLGGEAVSRDRNHMAEIGARGGYLRGKRARMKAEGQQDIAEIRQEIDLSIRAENGEFGKGAIIKDGKVIKRDVDATDAMEHFRDGLR